MSGWPCVICLVFLLSRPAKFLTFTDASASSIIWCNHTGKRAMIDHQESSEMVTLFAKIVLALGATSLLFLDDKSISMIVASSPQTDSLSFLSQVCLGVTFLAIVLFLAVWDCALAILVCLFVICWILVTRRQPNRQQPGVQDGAESKRVSQRQAYAIRSQLDRDNDVRYMYSLDTPLPTPNLQTSVPMAFTMGDRSYSTTVV